MADLKPITCSRFYVEFNGFTEKLVKSVQEVSFQGDTKGHETALASTKGGKTYFQSSSTGFGTNPDFTIEVYVTEGDMDFYNWYKDTMPTSSGGGGNWSGMRRDGSIVAYDAADQEVMRWTIKKAWPKSYKVSDFAVDSTDFAVETYTMVCEDIRRDK